MSAIIFDTETTGKVDPVAIEAAWLRLRDLASGEVTGHFVQQYNPGKPIELGAIAVHHIIDEDLVGCLPSETCTLPSDIEYLIGHNIDYDWAVMGQPDVKRICTLALARKWVPGLDAYNQSAMLYHFWANERARARSHLRGAHSALADVQTCHYVLMALVSILRENGELQPDDGWERLWEISEAARIPTIMPFGKHKGTALVDLPSDYLSWLKKQPELDPYLAKALNDLD